MRHVVAHRGAQHVRALEQQGLAGTRIAHNAPGCGLQQAVEQAQQGALAAAVGADQRDPFARLDLQRHTPECLDRAEPHADVAQVEQWGRAR